MIPPTPRQLDVLKAISLYHLDRGFPISIRELGAKLGIRSTNAVNEHLVRLLRMGLVKHEPNRARTLQLTDAGRREVAGV